MRDDAFLSYNVSMKAAYLIEPGKIELRDIPTPTPSKGEILVKIDTALTCGTDKKAFLRGHPMIPMPGPFGHEFSGTVASTGKNLKGFKEGDEIMAVHSAPCGKCWYCSKGLFNQCLNIMDTKILGAFAEYIVIPGHIAKRNVFLKPRHLSFEAAAMLEPLSCVTHALTGIGSVKGKEVVVIGAGPIALMHILLLHHRGAEVTVLGRDHNKLSFARSFGAQRAIVLSEAISSGLRADLLIECTGSVDVWELSPSLVRRGGTVLLFGGCKTGTEARFDTHKLHYEEITLKGSFHFTPRDVKEAYRLIKEGIAVERLISEVCGLSDIQEVFSYLAQGKGLKYALKPSK